MAVELHAERSRRSAARALSIAAAGAAVAALGAATLLGWGLGEPRLASAGAGLIPMAPSTALLFLLCGSSVCLRASSVRHHATSRASAAAATLAALAASTLLVLSVLGVHPAVERLGFAAVGEVQGAPIGHMSPVAAACFLLVSVSLLASLRSPGSRLWRFVSVTTAVVVLASSVVFVLAYLYGAPMLYGGAFVPPALPTVLAFGVLGAALFALSARAIPDTGVQGRDPERQRAFDTVLVTFALLASGLVAAGHYRPAF